MGFADKMNSMPKFVVSTTLTDLTWGNSVVIGGNVAAQVADLSTRFGGDILVAGSGQLVRALMKEGLIAEYRLMVFPVVLGSGRRLFAEDIPLTMLKLVDYLPVGPDGVVVQTFVPAG